MIWRDDWTGMPVLVILAEEGARGGVIEDAALFLFDVHETPITVTDQDGHALRVHLPDDALNETGVIAGIDLTVETAHANQESP